MESGGYLQFVDIENTPHCDDGTMHQDTIFKKWEQAAIEFSGLSNRRFFHTAATKQEMKDAGFVDIQEKRYKLPIGTWSSDPKYRDIGRVSFSSSANIQARSDRFWCSYMQNTGR